MHKCTLIFICIGADWEGDRGPNHLWAISQVGWAPQENHRNPKIGVVVMVIVIDTSVIYLCFCSVCLDSFSFVIFSWRYCIISERIHCGKFSKFLNLAPPPPETIKSWRLCVYVYWAIPCLNVKILHYFSR